MKGIVQKKESSCMCTKGCATVPVHSQLSLSTSTSPNAIWSQQMYLSVYSVLSV